MKLFFNFSVYLNIFEYRNKSDKCSIVMEKFHCIFKQIQDNMEKLVRDSGRNNTHTVERLFSVGSALPFGNCLSGCQVVSPYTTV